MHVTSARLALADADRSDIGDEVIGKAFAHSPAGSDRIWPAEPVRESIEFIGSREFENGHILGRLNSRGVTARGVYDGGQQERVIAARCCDWSTSAKTNWPRTARILRSIAESYDCDAIREDLEAEPDANRMYSRAPGRSSVDHIIVLEQFSQSALDDEGPASRRSPRCTHGSPPSLPGCRRGRIRRRPGQRRLCVRLNVGTDLVNDAPDDRALLDELDLNRCSKRCEPEAKSDLLD